MLFYSVNKGKAYDSLKILAGVTRISSVPSKGAITSMICCNFGALMQRFFKRSVQMQFKGFVEICQKKAKLQVCQSKHTHYSNYEKDSEILRKSSYFAAGKNSPKPLSLILLENKTALSRSSNMKKLVLLQRDLMWIYSS